MERKPFFIQIFFKKNIDLLKIFRSYLEREATAGKYILLKNVGFVLRYFAGLQNSRAEGTVYAEEGYNTGGLSGNSLNESSIINSSADVNVTGEDFVGGLVGILGDWDEDVSGNVINSYQTPCGNWVF